MEVHYYLSVNPLEALIASQLEPIQFGQYMSTGTKNGSYERIMFAELEGEFGNDFDWDYAKKRTVPHEDGRPKHSVWMSVYRSLEFVDLSKLKSLYLTTRDGRSLELAPQKFDAGGENREYYIYQELCPITPLVVSRLNPVEFSEYMTDLTNKVSVPKLVFADLKTVDPDDYEHTGNIGGAYDRNLNHLRDCIKDVTTQKDKPNKNVERSVGGFSYQSINTGIYFGDGSNVVVYPLPSQEELRSTHYDWARSAMIL
ncbi:MAG: hypothetical protein GVY29_13165 [Spirochaetes bacterium]|jgi:hypothetical protein|nr:hypothetical protein [Spirochaetota bacterium]